jgi:uncharacterized membrane protein
MDKQNKQLFIDSVLKFFKVIAYVLLSALISIPVQEALQSLLSVYIPDVYTLTFINALIASITKIIKEKVSNDSLLNKVL